MLCGITCTSLALRTGKLSYYVAFISVGARRHYLKCQQRESTEDSVGPNCPGRRESAKAFPYFVCGGKARRHVSPYARQPRAHAALFLSMLGSAYLRGEKSTHHGLPACFHVSVFVRSMSHRPCFEAVAAASLSWILKFALNLCGTWGFLFE